MGRIITLEEVPELRGQEKFWAYCALDTTGTREVFDVLRPRLDEETARIYGFERALQAPAMAMMRRGVLIDEQARRQVVKDLNRELVRSAKAVNDLEAVYEVWDGREKDTGACPTPKRKDGKHSWPRGVADDDPAKVCEACGAPRMKPTLFNPNSSTQNWRLFAVLHEVPRPTLRKKDKSYGIDDDVLDRICKKRKDLCALTAAVKDVRGIKKQLGFLKAKLTPDGRYPSSFNVGAAWTGRWSSSKNPYGLGGNMQNISERHRHIFRADPGMEMFYADLKQAESLTVAYLAGDETYIEAHQSGDTHTYVARLLWPELPWTGDLKKDKKVAGANPEWDQAPGHSFRFQSKRIQHGGNYGLTPPGISMIAHIPLKEAERAYNNYHEKFPGVGAWQRATKAQVMGSEPLTNPVGRRIRLFGRPWDGHTYKQGLSYRPQSAVADILDLSLWRLWYAHDPELVQVLAQVHDAILGQYPVEQREDAIMAIVESMTIPVPIIGADGVERIMMIPTEIAVGQNWGKKSESNPGGLEEVY